MVPHHAHHHHNPYFQTVKISLTNKSIQVNPVVMLKLSKTILKRIKDIRMLITEVEIIKKPPFNIDKTIRQISQMLKGGEWFTRQITAFLTLLHNNTYRKRLITKKNATKIIYAMQSL